MGLEIGRGCTILLVKEAPHTFGRILADTSATRKEVVRPALVVSDRDLVKFEEAVDWRSPSELERG